MYNENQGQFTEEILAKRGFILGNFMEKIIPLLKHKIKINGKTLKINAQIQIILEAIRMAVQVGQYFSDFNSPDFSLVYNVFP